jgi:hypothetical protein
MGGWEGAAYRVYGLLGPVHEDLPLGHVLLVKVDLHARRSVVGALGVFLGGGQLYVTSKIVMVRRTLRIRFRAAAMVDMCKGERCVEV